MQDGAERRTTSHDAERMDETVIGREEDDDRFSEVRLIKRHGASVVLDHSCAVFGPESSAVVWVQADQVAG